VPSSLMGRKQVGVKPLRPPLPGGTGVFIVPTLSRKPWDDLRMRRAVLGYGLDRHAIAKAALVGYGWPDVGAVFRHDQ
jgi:hypothetical protein